MRQEMSSSSGETYLSTSEGGITPASVIAVGAVLPGLATIAVCLRLFVRVKLKTISIGADDWLIFISLVSFTTENACKRKRALM